MKSRQNKMMGYLAVTAGVGCVSSVANAAVVFYGNASNNNLQTDPLGIDFGSNGGSFNVDLLATSGSFFRYDKDDGTFTRGGDLGGYAFSQSGFYFYAYYGGTFQSGAVAGDQNYANISFDGLDGVFEAVAQFYFDGAGGGYLIAIATINDIPNPQDLSLVGGSTLSISAGKAMIDAAAIPEPSSIALLALGATGLIARRQRRKAV